MDPAYLKTARGFDRLAASYDGLARLVYGSQLQKAQCHFLSGFAECRSILVLGGGTGWILPLLLEAAPLATVTYVELSPKMMLKSQALIRATAKKWERVNWHLGTLEALPLEPAFDGVVTHFFLDLFQGDPLTELLQNIQTRCRPASKWSCVDFQRAKSWPMSWVSSGLIRSMYWFFRWTTGIQAKRICPYASLIAALGWTVEREAEFAKGMVLASFLQMNP